MALEALSLMRPLMSQSKARALGVACGAGLLIGHAAEAQMSGGSTRMVDVLGTATRVLEIGLDHRTPGQPVVVLQAGGGTALEGWGDWPMMVAEMAPRVGFDRPGLGESRYDGVSPTPDRMALHTHTLLESIGVAPPYILVGHSWGAELIGRYAMLYPEDVVGMVYLDPTPRGGPLLWYGTEDPDEIAAIRAADPEDNGAPPPGAEGLWAEAEIMVEWLTAPPPDARLLPTADVPVAILLAAPPPPIPSPPPGAPSYMTADWARAFQAHKVSFFSEQIRGREHGTLIVATDSEHFVFRSDPKLATEAVRRVMAAIQATR
jgi:pimeloyl-ACP methyl ester carboxylesterase